MGKVKLVMCGKRIKQLREKKGISVNNLAKKAGVSQSYLRSLELEEKNPTVERLAHICIALDISLRDFFSDDIMTSLMDDDALEKVYKLNKKQRKALCAFLDTII